MSHQALARRWRPRDFKSLIGQQPVVKALSHALSTQRLHHAYLLTGTRGVGKTTVARILAKALNCERGVSAEPCGVCSACLGIDAGRFVDYIEMDAASNRGVDEMTQVLEQAVYSPSAGRYKVYVIDEVHMLSNHAFNAMLKTLEEPPAHVIFVLATTDPQKVPVTVLSRCLQFNLKNMMPRAISAHLKDILVQEEIFAEPAGLDHIAQAARGSMRDALSLLDQAIAFGGGKVNEADVREMLGVVDSHYAQSVIESLINGDAGALVSLAEQVVQANLAIDILLQDVASLLQRIAVVQAGVKLADNEHELPARYAEALAREDVQVYYQVALHGARDASLAVDPVSGLTMTLLRMYAFRPAVESNSRPVTLAPSALPWSAVAVRTTITEPSPTRPAVPKAVVSKAVVPFDGNWPALAGSISLGGLAQQFLHQSELLEEDDYLFRVRVPIKALAEATTVNKVRDALSAHFGRPVRLVAELGAVSGVTAAVLVKQQSDERSARAQVSIESDPFVQTLITDFGGRVLPESVRSSEQS
jgi:DNA polymerase III subunit gamma/tau